MASSFPDIALNSNDCDYFISAKAASRVSKEGCPDDDDAVAVLPDDWIPRHSSPILANYLKQCRTDHQSVLDDITKSAVVVNQEVDKKIRSTAENLLAQVKQNHCDMECLVKKCICARFLEKQALEGVYKNIKEISFQCIENIATFKREASALERERADKLKVILREKFQNLVTVGHQAPKRLLHDFDGRIYEINQQLLSNSRAFTELEAQLRMQLDNNVAHARSTLYQLTLGIGMVCKERDTISALHNTSEESTVKKRSASSDRIPETSQFEIDESINQSIIEIYRTAVLKIYTSFHRKLDSLEKNLCNNECIKEPSQLHLNDFYDIQSLHEQPLHQISNYCKNKSSLKSLLETNGIDIISMQKSLSSLGECIQNTYCILYDTGHLWDSHILRSAFAQKLTIASIEDILTTHDTIELSNEIPISIAMEQLRCSSDADKLQQQYEYVKMILARTGEMYLQHSEAERGRLAEYMNLSALMTKTLLSEFNLLLEKYPRMLQFKNNTDAANLLLETPWQKASFLRLPFPRAILQTQLQEIALKNWKDGFLESFEGNMSLFSEELRHQAQLWVEERSSSLNMRFSMKMLSHSIRLERLKASREVRLAEIRHHDSRLQSHLNAVYDFIERLPIQASEFVVMDGPGLYPLVRWVDRIRTSINEVLAEETPNPESRMLKMLSYARRLPIHRSLFEESLDKALANYKRHLEHRFQEVRISNLRFIANIKLFNEGGKYAAQEALKSCTALTKAGEVLETCSNKAFDALNHRRLQLLAYADTLLLPLMRVVEDTAKMTIRSNTRQQDRRKTASKKK